jgi:hypothetical protein
VQKLRLYWCETDDHDEDWFVVARRAHEARRFFQDAEGYNDGFVTAQFILVLPDELQNAKHRGWPANDVLIACGATILRAETPRVIEIDGVQFVEGMLEHRLLELTDDQLEMRGQGRPNRTARQRTS